MSIHRTTIIEVMVYIRPLDKYKWTLYNKGMSKMSREQQVRRIVRESFSGLVEQVRPDDVVVHPIINWTCTLKHSKPGPCTIPTHSNP